ncbi:MAG: enoyl-CoA hydratase-related protein [Sporomusaceae bacterium]|nr:enoyl-CoA hydratase-related protein [Sporomusaceae bacterium]
MAEFKNLLYECERGIAMISMNRPEAMNAFNADTLGELEAVLAVVEEDPAVGAVIITGVGKAFVAGADIAMNKGLAPIEGREVSVRGHRLFSKIENLGKPVIAAVNGYALGGGCELALACDIRVAAEKAKFGLPEVSLGIIPGWGGTQRLPRLIGKGRAKYYAMTAEMIDAAEACRIGLVNKVVAAEELLPAAKHIANVIMSKGPVAVRLVKAAINNGLKMDLDSALAYEVETYTTSFSCEDRTEGMTAFLEKRSPRFQGR